MEIGGGRTTGMGGSVGKNRFCAQEGWSWECSRFLVQEIWAAALWVIYFFITFCWSWWPLNILVSLWTSWWPSYCCAHSSHHTIPCYLLALFCFSGLSSISAFQFPAGLGLGLQAKRTDRRGSELTSNDFRYLVLWWVTTAHAKNQPVKPHTSVLSPREIWQSTSWLWMWTICSTCMPACCMSAGSSSSAANSALWVQCGGFMGRCRGAMAGTSSSHKHNLPPSFFMLLHSACGPVIDLCSFPSSFCFQFDHSLCTLYTEASIIVI